VALDAQKRERALLLAAAFLELANANIGRSRDELEEVCAAVAAEPRERRLADGLCKLVEDRCEFEQQEGVDPEELRREIFSRASLARREGAFDRRARSSRSRRCGSSTFTIWRKRRRYFCAPRA
jgi:predicted nuclease of restriction endonuclease-like RecB superfamily